MSIPQHFAVGDTVYLNCESSFRHSWEGVVTYYHRDACLVLFKGRQIAQIVYTEHLRLRSVIR